MTKDVILLTFSLRFSYRSFYSKIRCTSFRPSIISSRDKILRLLATRRSRNSLSRASKILLDDRAKAVYSRAFWNLLRPGNSEFTAGNPRSAELALSASEDLHFTCTIRSRRIFCTLPLNLARCLLHDHPLVLYSPLCPPLEHNHHPLRRLRRARKHSRAFSKRIISSLSGADDSFSKNYFYTHLELIVVERPTKNTAIPCTSFIKCEVLLMPVICLRYSLENMFCNFFNVINNIMCHEDNIFILSSYCNHVQRNLDQLSKSLKWHFKWGRTQAFGKSQFLKSYIFCKQYRTAMSDLFHIII